MTKLISIFVRYNDGADSIRQFRVTLVENVLVRVLWQDFFISGNSKGHEKISLGKETNSSEDNVPLKNKTVYMKNTKYPMPYLQDLGKCIIDILLGIYTLDCNLISAFIVEYEKNCIAVFQQEAYAESIERIILLILLLEQHAVLKGETWPLAYLVGPMLAKSFSFIKSSVSYFVEKHLFTPQVSMIFSS